MLTVGNHHLLSDAENKNLVHPQTCKRMFAAFRIDIDNTFKQSSCKFIATPVSTHIKMCFHYSHLISFRIYIEWDFFIFRHLEVSSSV